MFKHAHEFETLMRQWGTDIRWRDSLSLCHIYSVDFHKSALKRELMLNSTAELTQFAIKHHIIGT